MTSGDWGRLDDLYHRALDVPREERSAFLDMECAGDAALRADLEGLLSANDHAEGFLKDPPALSLLFEPESGAGADIGKRIGAYETSAVIGHGGMGTVYRASRADDQYRKQVAIKVIRRGMDSEGMVRRFRTERQILASLDHPHIARLFDGGVTDDRVPFYVMEFVEGEPIDRYADRHRLTIAQRIKLFLPVCSAVEFAHRNLVVHRDLKPANVLVTPEGSPKLLDFGIAKLLEPDSADETIDSTATGMRMMTPGYASPEQVCGKLVTTASDVYSLGVLLYELLTGCRPLRLDSSDPREVARIVCEETPAKPSAAVLTARENTDTACARSTTVERLHQSLAGDLDNILLRALDKEASRRYSSVEHFSEDLRRYLGGLPVSARPDTLLYRSGKFVRRHPAGIAAAAVLAITLAAGIGATLWQARVARVERARAERRFNDVRTLANSFLFEFDDSIKNLEGMTASRELIVKRALQYLNSLTAEAGGDFALQREIAGAYDKVSDVQGNFRTANLGDPKGALESSRKAVAIRESLVKREPADGRLGTELAGSYQRMANLLWATQNADEALAVARKGIAAGEVALQRAPADRNAQRVLAGVYADFGALQSDAKNGAALYVESSRKAVALLEGLIGSDPEDRQSRFLLARAYRFRADAMGDIDDRHALLLFRKAVEMSEALSALEPTNTEYSKGLAGAYNDLGSMLKTMHDLPGDLECQQRALAVLERMAASDSKNMQVRRDLGTVLRQAGEIMSEVRSPSQGTPLLERSLREFESMPGPSTFQVRLGKALGQCVLGDNYAQLGRSGAAVALFERCVPELNDLRRGGLHDAGVAQVADRAAAILADLRPR